MGHELQPLTRLSKSSARRRLTLGSRTSGHLTTDLAIAAPGLDATLTLRETPPIGIIQLKAHTPESGSVVGGAGCITPCRALPRGFWGSEGEQ